MVDDAAVVKGLREAFSSGITRSYEWRIRQLKQIVKLTEEKETEICEAVAADMGKPHFQTYSSEIALAKMASKLAIRELKHWMAPEKVSTPLIAFPSSSEIVTEPLGVVLIISAWNYPFLLGMSPLIGAVAAGNAIVLKPSEVAPATSALLANLLPLYLDNSAICVIEGGVEETKSLLDKPWDKIFYTGSGRVGRIVMSAAAKHLSPVTLELGGKCPVLVDSTVDLEIASKRIAFAKWQNNNGQACISPDYVITLKSFAPKLINSLRMVIESFYGKDPLQSSELSQIINLNHFVRLRRFLDDPVLSNKIIYGGKCDEIRLLISPTLLLDVPLDSSIMGEEIFGPLLPIITVENWGEAFAIVRSVPKPLATYVVSRDKTLVKQAVERISAGAMIINDAAVHLLNPNLPFGGVGESGMGCYNGKFSFDAFSHRKAVLHRNFMFDIKSRYPPYTTRKKRILRSVLEGNYLELLLVLIGWRR